MDNNLEIIEIFAEAGRTHFQPNLNLPPENKKYLKNRFAENIDIRLKNSGIPSP